MTRIHQVLIPVYNGAKHIEATIESVLGQDIEGLKVIVSDNASEDETPRILSRYEADRRVTISRNDTNIGMFGNWMHLLGMVTAGSFTLISHDDLFSNSGALSEAVAALYIDDTCPVVFSDVTYIDTNGNEVGQRRFHRKGSFDCSLWVQKSIVSCRNQLGQPLAVRTSAARGIGYDETIQYAGDFDFAARLALTQGQPIHIPKPLFQYRMHTSSGTLKLQKYALSDMRKISQKIGLTLTPMETAEQWMSFHLTTRMRAVVLMAMQLKNLRENRG